MRRLPEGQFELAWKLASLHVEGLTTAECPWRPAAKGPHVHQGPDGVWRADRPAHEGYDLGPPSIAWLTWHMLFWWEMVLDHSFDHSFGGGTFTREQVTWPGTADGVRKALGRLHEGWEFRVALLADDDLCSWERTHWPFQRRRFGDVVAWVNVELAKNAAEIGYARFLYAVRGDGQLPPVERRPQDS